MKNLIILGCALILAMSCMAQTVVPVEKTIDFINAGKGIPDGTYLKDTNLILNKYIGTWKGVNEGKNYTFTITKYTSQFEDVTTDILLIRYLITAPDGTIIKDTRNSPTEDTNVIEGDYFSKGASYYVSNYYGEESKCWRPGTVIIRMKNIANTSMSLVFVPDNDIFWTGENCPAIGIPEHLLPIKVMMLTKQ